MVDLPTLNASLRGFRKLVQELDKDFTLKNIDKQRLIRAYSVYLQTGKSMSEWYKRSKLNKIYNQMNQLG